MRESTKMIMVQVLVNAPRLKPRVPTFFDKFNEHCLFNLQVFLVIDVIQLFS